MSEQTKKWRELANAYKPAPTPTELRHALIAAAAICDQTLAQNKEFYEDLCDYRADNAKLRELLATARDIAENATQDAWSFAFTRIKLSELKDAIDADLKEKP